MDLFSQWIAGEDIYVQLDAREEEVVVPQSHKDDPMLTLKMSNSFNYIPNINENGIAVNLRFDGSYFECSIPWEKVWGLRTESGEQKIWKEDIPKEVALKMAKEVFSSIGNKLFKRAEGEQKEEAQPASKPAKRKPNLKRVK